METAALPSGPAVRVNALGMRGYPFQEGMNGPVDEHCAFHNSSIFCLKRILVCDIKAKVAYMYYVHISDKLKNKQGSHLEQRDQDTEGPQTG